jgi:hypothetical protein
MTRDRIAAMVKAERETGRTALLTLRLTPDERRRLDKAAAGQKLKPATLARVLILAGLDDLG